MSDTVKTELVVPRERPSGMLAIIMVVTMVLAAAACLVIFFALGRGDKTAAETPDFITREDFLKLEQRVNEQALQIAQLEARPAATDAQPTGLSYQDTYAFATDINALKSALGTMQTDMQSLTQRFDASQQGAEQKLLLTLKLNRLRQVAESGGVFTHELQAVKALVAGNPQLLSTLTLLEAYAAAGLTPHDRLLADYRILAMLLDKKLKEQAQTNWYERLIAAVQNLVTIRPAGQFANDITLNTIGERLSARRYQEALDLMRPLLDSLGLQDFSYQVQAQADLKRVLDQAERDALTPTTATEQP